MTSFTRRPSIPPHEVLDLVASKLDPKTLAIASCVSKSWSYSMSADHLWQTICATHFPSVSYLHAALPYRRIYALGHSSAKRRLQLPTKPRLTLDSLLFAITIPRGKSQTFTILIPCNELEKDPNGLFRFDIGVNDEKLDVIVDDGAKITCSVVLKGYEGIFTMMERKGRGSTDWWFTEELPSPGCCAGGWTSGLVAELMLGWCEMGEKKVVEKVSVGVMNVASWRYVDVDDALRYLQHFLLPCGE